MSGWSSDAKIHIFFILTPTNENKKALLVTMPQSKAPHQLPKAPTNSPEGERWQTPVQGSGPPPTPPRGREGRRQFKVQSSKFKVQKAWVLSKLLNSQTSNNYCLHSHTPKLPTLLKRMFQGNHTCHLSLLTCHLKKLLTCPSS